MFCSGFGELDPFRCREIIILSASRVIDRPPPKATLRRPCFQGRIFLSAMLASKSRVIPLLCVLLLTACQTHKTAASDEPRSSSEWHVSTLGDDDAAGSLSSP